MFAQQLNQAAELIRAAQLKQAKPLLQELYHETEKQGGAQSEAHLQAILLIGIWHTAAGEYEAAKPLLQRVAEDENHAAAQVALAQLYRESGQYEQARDVLQTLLSKLPENPTEPNRTFAQAQDELGRALLGLTNIDTALPHFERAAAHLQQHYGMQDLDTIRAFRHAAMIYRLQGHDEQTLSVLNSLLPISEQIYPHSHPETAEILAEIAHTHDERGDFTTAHQAYQRAHQIMLATYGNEHPRYARLLCRHAMHFLQQKLPEKALPILQQAAAIYVQTFDDDHPAVQNLLRFIVVMQLAMDDVLPDMETIIQ